MSVLKFNLNSTILVNHDYGPNDCLQNTTHQDTKPNWINQLKQLAAKIFLDNETP